MAMQRVGQMIAEQMTGCREVTPSGPLYLKGGTPVSDKQARMYFLYGGTVEDPNAGAGSYPNFLKRVGIAGQVVAFDQTSSAGDWQFLVEMSEGQWRIMSQESRYPYRGFRYMMDDRRYYGTLSDVQAELMEK